MQDYVVKNQKKLRQGITTGTCAAAAAEAAATALLMGAEPQEIQVQAPRGTLVSVSVNRISVEPGYAEYMVRKDSGDDPDVTNRVNVYVRVERISGTTIGDCDKVFSSEQYPNLLLDGGEGIGRVTREGLEQKVGFAAINQVPRKMIFDAVGRACQLAGCDEKLLILVSIPAGVELAEKTFNPKLGIVGGISVLGTSGILEPMSEQAIVATIEMEIRQLANQGRRGLLVTPGNYGQAYVSRYLGLDLQTGVKSSNYIGDALDFAVAYEFEQVLLVGNIGKLVKLAAGIFNTHSKVADGRGEIFGVHTALAGGNRELVKQVMESINTDAMLGLLEEAGLKEAVMEGICAKIKEHVTQRVGDKLQVGVACFSEKYGFLGMTEGTKEIIAQLADERNRLGLTVGTE